MNWYVLHTRPRSEKKVEEQLLSMGINAYCPTRSEVKFWSDRKKIIEVPVLPSMVLVNIDDKDFNIVFECSLVIRYMFFSGKRAIVRQSEIEVLKKYLKGGFNLINGKLSNYEIGDSFCLPSFNNENGIVYKISNNNLWIHLKSIGYRVKLKLA